jgi:hypothetical protein
MIENVVVAGSIMMKGPAGILIPLGIELFVDGAATLYLYNLLSVAILLFIAAMSGPRSEAAFCIVIPIFAGIMELFGWFRLATPSATGGLVILTILMGLFGVFIYMKDQNKQNYGTVGPGSTLFNLAFYLMCFSIALTLISGFSIFPGGATQPISGTCATGFTCDAYNNIDFYGSVGSVSHSGGLLDTIISAASPLVDAMIASVILMLNIITGIIAFPIVLNSTLNGIFPGITSNAVYLIFLVALEGIIVFIYVLGFYELTRQPQGGVGTI